MKLILPKTYVDPVVIDQFNLPFFFLAGPIKGGDNWQEKMCLRVGRHVAEFIMAIPCRWGPKNQLYEFRMDGNIDRFDNQTGWEHLYLDFAANRSRNYRGCIIFWLPCESKIHPREDGQPYARDTYGELAAWRRTIRHDRAIHLAVGIERDFPGREVIVRNFQLDLGFCYPIETTLEATAARAAELAANK